MHKLLWSQANIMCLRNQSLLCCVVLCRPDAVGDLLQLALPVLMAGLQDKDDSVQAAAAEALVPLAPLLLQMQAEDVSSPAHVGAPALRTQ